jgi:hypothetical protein
MVRGRRGEVGWGGGGVLIFESDRLGLAFKSDNST